MAKTRTRERTTIPAIPDIKNDVVSLKSLIPYAKNSRKHTEKQIDVLVKLIKEYGFTNPVLVWKGNEIIAGHARVIAAERAGLTKVPVRRCDHLTDAQRRALVIADNKSAMIDFAWNDEHLNAELSFLNDLGVDLTLTGFDTAELPNFDASPSVGTTDEEDDVPAKPTKAKTKLGDLIILGRHRLVCGDSTSEVDVQKLLNGKTPVLMVTDPPYGVDYNADWRNEMGLDAEGKKQRKKSGKVIDPSKVQGRAVGKVKNDHTPSWKKAYELFKGSVAYVWHASYFTDVVASELKNTGFEIKAQIIWNKNNIVFGRGDYHWKHEPCWYVVRGGKKHNWKGGRKQNTVWDIDKPIKSETGHSTQKPVECMRRPMLNNSDKGDIIYDPFGGSGTTMIAAESEGRICYMMELDPLYCDVIVKRWEQFTGGKAQRPERSSTK